MKRYEIEVICYGSKVKMVAVPDGSIVLFDDPELQQIMRESKAFRAIAERRVAVAVRPLETDDYDWQWRAYARRGFRPERSGELLTAIESAMTATTTGGE